jgi:hypothetical protein
MTLTRARTIQYIGILCSLLLIATGYWYFSVRAGVKTNTGAVQLQGTGDLSAGLVGYWKLDDGSGSSATDSSTNGNTGTLTGGPTWTMGQIGGAIDLDGTDDKVVMTGSAALNTVVFTLSAWVNPDSVSGGVYRTYLSKGAAASNANYYLEMHDDEFGAGFHDGSIWHEHETTAFNATAGQWYHTVATYDGSRLKIYVNGAEVLNDAETGVPVTSNTQITLGNQGSADFGGLIDEVRIYDRALSADEAANLYRLTAPTGVDTSLKGYWSFNSDALSGTTAYDRSGAGNTGTLTNGPAIAEGRVGQALNFDGSNDYIDAGAANALDDASNLSGCAWIYPESLPTFGTIISKGPWQFEVRTGGYLTFWVDASPNDGRWNTPAGAIPTNAWQHVCFSYNRSISSDPILYVNGLSIQVTEDQTPTGSIASDASSNVYIGAWTGPAEHFDGPIDEVRLYNRILTAAEIKSLYDRGAPDKTNTSGTQAQGTGRLDSGLAGYWKLDENTGTSAADASTNGNTGTLTNGPTWTTGQIGSAVNFDGTNDEITTTNNQGTAAHLKTLSLSVWFKTSTASGKKLIGMEDVQTGTGATNTDRQIWIGTDGKIRFAVYASALKEVVSNATLNDNAWHHAVGVSTGDNGTLFLYIDGALQGTTSVGGTIFTYTDSYWRIGGYENSLWTNGADGYFTGQMDEVRIYDRALSADEVANLYRLTTPTGVDTSLKGYWSFDGSALSGSTAYDRSGAGNTGTLTNGPAITEGRVGQALSFDGSNDYIDLGNPTALRITGSHTLSAWVKSDTVNDQDIINKGTNNQNGYSYLLNANNDLGSNRFACLVDPTGAGTSAGTRYSATTDDIGNWYHVACVYNASSQTLDLYVNGVLSNGTLVGTVPTAAFNTTDSVSIGRRYNNSKNWDGLIDEPRIYNRALTAAEIAAQYAAAAPDKTNTSVSTPQGTGRLDSGLAGYWKLDENTGTSAADASTNSNTGTLTNGPSWTTGRIGSAVDFDGTNDYISYPNTIAFDSNDFAIAAWVMRDGTGGGPDTTNLIFSQRIDSVGDGNPDVGLYLNTSHQAAFYIRDNVGSGLSVTNTAATSTGIWYHAVGVKTAAEIRLYVDGTLVGTAAHSLSGDFDAGATLRFIGKEVYGGADRSFMNGKIDEVRVYNRALSADDVAQIYRLTTPTGTDTSLRGYWSFNGQDMNGTTAYDRSGAGNNGTLTNGATITEGKVGQGLLLDGTNDYAALPANMSILQNTAAATLAGWYKLTSLGGTEHEILAISKNNGGTPTSESRATTAIAATGKFYCGGRSADADAFQSVATVGDAPVGAWTHYVCTINYTTDTITIYLNGQVQPTTGTPNFSAATTANTVSTNGAIGAEDNGAPYPFNGQLDEQRIYNRVLSASEIKALYSSGR